MKRKTSSKRPTKKQLKRIELETHLAYLRDLQTRIQSEMKQLAEENKDVQHTIRQVMKALRELA